MNDSPSTSAQPAPIPPDDLERSLTHARPDEDENLPHVGVVWDTYTILLTGEDTAGRYTLIDMHVPPGGGPPPHRHDFEEMFSVLEGEIEATFRGEKTTVRAGETINVPANAPHSFTNASDRPARLLCVCSPAGQEEFFLTIGVRTVSRTAPPPRARGGRPGSVHSESRRRESKNCPPNTERSFSNGASGIMSSNRCRAATFQE